MTASWSPVTAAEALEIERLLLAGHAVLEVRRRTGRSATTIRAVRAACGIPAQQTGRRPRPDPTVPVEPPEGDWQPSGNPCALLYVQRPHQRRWLELLEAATAHQRFAMRRAVIQVLGVSTSASDDTIALTALADRRTADELARLYLHALGMT